MRGKYRLLYAPDQEVSNRDWKIFWEAVRAARLLADYAKNASYRSRRDHYLCGMLRGRITLCLELLAQHYTFGGQRVPEKWQANLFRAVRTRALLVRPRTFREMVREDWDEQMQRVTERLMGNLAAWMELER